MTSHAQCIRYQNNYFCSLFGRPTPFAYGRLWPWRNGTNRMPAKGHGLVRLPDKNRNNISIFLFRHVYGAQFGPLGPEVPLVDLPYGTLLAAYKLYVLNHGLKRFIITIRFRFGNLHFYCSAFGS